MARRKFTLSSDILSWPETQALMRRLGIDTTSTRSLRMSFELDGVAIIEHEFLATDHSKPAESESDLCHLTPAH